MSRLSWKFINTLPALTLTNSRIASGETLQVIVGKLQAQIDAGAIGGRFFADNTGNASSKTWTVPAGVFRVRFKLFGPGANGIAGQTFGPRSGGGGGGAGSLAEGYLTVTPGSTLAYLIPPNNSGTSAWIVASSGTTGIIVPAGAQGTAAGVGGVGGAVPTIGSAHTGLVIGFAGQNGGDGFAAALGLTTLDMGGFGANTERGAGGRGRKDAAGGNASGWGAGGGGCPSGDTPGTGGAAGLILEY